MIISVSEDGPVAVSTLVVDLEADQAVVAAVSDAFGAGEQNPLIVLFEGADAAATAAGATESIAAVDGVVDVSPVQPAENADVAFVAVTPEHGPADTRPSDLVTSVCIAMDDVQGARVSVTGQTAVDVDVNKQLSTGLITYLICVVGLSLLLLTLVFRSIVVPLPATVGFLMSFAAGLGVTVAVFQWAWSTPSWSAWSSCPRLCNSSAKPTGGCPAGWTGCSRTSTPKARALERGELPEPHDKQEQLAGSSKA
ncbi:MMPL family transporter [Streptomyces sp. NPDC050535]|uniref:MMPL family transporter n=1 Tax=Streptomyces sp. NPDC050535 TaxID=3365626 RepID=UPI0037B6FDA8